MEISAVSSTTIADQPNQLSKSIDIAVKLAGDFAVMPGTSQILQGKLGSGLAHAALGIAGGAILGPIGWVAVAANSFTKSLSDENIWAHVSGATKSMAKNREENKAKDLVDTIRAIKAKNPDERSESEREILAAAQG